MAEAASKFLFDATNYYRYYVKHGHNLIGDPEFEMWIGKPSILDVQINLSTQKIGTSGPDLYGCRVVQYNGSDSIKITDCTRTHFSYALDYLNAENHFESIGIYKKGFLPFVTLNCDDMVLKNCKKRFVVREVSLGGVLSTIQGMEIGYNANINIRAVDNAECKQSLKITDGGCLTINCDNDTKIDGSSIKSGGTLVVKSKTTRLSAGFKVERGGSLSINKF